MGLISVRCSQKGPGLWAEVHRASRKLRKDLYELGVCVCVFKINFIFKSSFRFTAK